MNPVGVVVGSPVLDDDEGLAASYEAHRDAYVATFDRLGVPYVIVDATSGAMGGSASEEFLVPPEVGEDTFVRCEDCGHAANVEAAEVPAPDPLDPDDAPAAEVVDTPGTATIATLVDELNRRDDLARDDRGGRRPTHSRTCCWPCRSPGFDARYGLQITESRAADAHRSAGDHGLAWAGRHSGVRAGPAEGAVEMGVTDPNLQATSGSNPTD